MCESSPILENMNFPNWARILHEAGFTPSSINIQFKEETNNEKSYTYWSTTFLERRHVRRLRCILTYTDSESGQIHTFTGDSSDSKMKALHSAAECLASIIESPNLMSKINDPPDALRRKWLSKIPSQVSYFMPLLPCFNKPLEASSTWHFYQLEFIVVANAIKADIKQNITNSLQIPGAESLASYMGLGDDSEIPFGVLFPCSIEPMFKCISETHFQGTFTLPKCESESGIVQVSLKNHTVVERDDWCPEDLRFAKKFNEAIEKWKFYGLPVLCPFKLVPEMKTNSEVEVFSPADRTYLLLPLKIFNKENWHDKKIEPKIEVDFSLIKAVCQSDTARADKTLSSTLDKAQLKYRKFQASHFVMLIERCIIWKHFEAKLYNLGEVLSTLDSQINHQKLNRTSITAASKHSLNHYLSQALTTFPAKEYERLEFLGDSVLLHYTVMNVFARNHNLVWNDDDIVSILSQAVKNQNICSSASRIGVQLGIHKNSKWQSHYHRKKITQDSSDIVSCELSNSTLSNVTEAVIGAIYASQIPERDHMIIGLLNELELPLPKTKEQEGSEWFCAYGSCLSQGYPFQLDRSWIEELVTAGTVIYCNREVSEKLSDGYKKLKSIFSIDDQVSLPKQTEILISVALFDDSLEYISDDANCDDEDLDDISFRTKIASNAKGLLRVAHMRETVFHVGNAALYVMVCNQIFHQHPKATAGDLHLIKICVTCDDVLSYVAVKTSIHLCLFDKSAQNIVELIKIMEESDALGTQLWSKQEDWLISGGLEEFKRRCTSCQTPRYHGIVAGQLLASKCKKLPKYITQDIAFSMKCIIGAFSLSCGLEKTWSILFPFFEELCVITAEELRTASQKYSSLGINHSKGKDASLMG